MTKELEKLFSELEKKTSEIIQKSGHNYSVLPELETYIPQIIIYVTKEKYSKKNENKAEYENVIEKTFDDLEDILKKKRRKRKDLPNPDKPADAEENRLMRSTEVFNVRIRPQIKRLVDEFKAKTGQTKREIVEEALLEYMLKNQPK